MKFYDNARGGALYLDWQVRCCKCGVHGVLTRWVTEDLGGGIHGCRHPIFCYWCKTCLVKAGMDW